MDCCTNNNNSILIPNPITQVAAMPYALYLSLQGKYFIGSTNILQFGNGSSAWVGLYDPINSGVNLHLYSWLVSNTGPSPIRAQIWFNSNPPGQPTLVLNVTPGNTTLAHTPQAKIQMYQATNVTGEPVGGVKAFVRRAPSGDTIGDEEVGKFIFPPGGSFVIFLSNPEAPGEPASATVSLTWWEEKII